MTASDVKTAILHRGLAENMGEETATALLERLSPDWAEVATKTDLQELRIDLRGEMGKLRDQISRDLRTVMFMIVGVALAFAGALVSIVASGALAAG